MKISAKGRYGLAAMIELAMNYDGGETVTILRISERLGISKIYLEQVFSLLKRAKLVTSSKGSQGGYRLSAAPEEITVFDILSAIELTLVETETTPAFEKLPAIDKALAKKVYRPLDEAVKAALSEVTLSALLEEAQSEGQGDMMMFYI